MISANTLILSIKGDMNISSLPGEVLRKVLTKDMASASNQMGSNDKTVSSLPFRYSGEARKTNGIWMQVFLLSN